MSSSKVLTVSYGRFSCTIEGYDDGVAALKEITAHFRDLADTDLALGDGDAHPPRLAPAAGEFAESPMPASAHTPPAGDGLGAAAKLARLRGLAPRAEIEWEDDDPADAIPRPAAPDLIDAAAGTPRGPARAQRPAAPASPAEAPLVAELRGTGRVGPAEDEEAPQDAGPTSPPLRADAAPRAPRRAGRLNEAAVARLMETADDKLHEADAFRRFDALRRLRHAVLATIADRGEREARPDLPDNRLPEGKPYADDLAQVVGAGRDRQGREGALLVLDEAHRIDAPVPEGLRERLLAAAEAAARDADDGSFSRSDVMLRIGAEGTARTDREEVLRAFGLLVRGGRVRSVAPGRFVLAGGAGGGGDAP